MKNFMKEAQKDAFEYASAQMAYGDGAGTRRKLIESAVSYKAARIPGYGNEFDKAVFSQDMAKHAATAKRQRKTKDVGAVASKNIKALARGDKNGMSTPLIVGIVALGVAHQTGYDKKALDYGRLKVWKARMWLKRKL